MINSAKMPTIKKGMVYLVGRAARFATNTSTNGTIAATIKPNDAPLNKIAAMVMGKKTAVITIMEKPTHLIRAHFTSLPPAPAPQPIPYPSPAPPTACPTGPKPFLPASYPP